MTTETKQPIVFAESGDLVIRLANNTETRVPLSSLQSMEHCKAQMLRLCQLESFGREQASEFAMACIRPLGNTPRQGAELLLHAHRNGKPML